MSKSRDRHEKRNRLYIGVIVAVWGILAVYTVIYGITAFAKGTYKNKIESMIRYTENTMSSIGSNLKKVNNPNKFNENCVFYDGTDGYMFDTDKLTTIAMKFYEVTGCQLYYVGLDLNKANNALKNEYDADKWANECIRSIIDDEYAVIIYNAEPIEIEDEDSYSGRRYIGIRNSIIYGTNTSELFNSSVRAMANDIVESAYSYSAYYANTYYDLHIIPLEIARQLFPEQFSRRTTVEIPDYYHRGTLLVELDIAYKQVKSIDTLLNILKIIWIVLFVMDVMTTVLIIKRKVYMQETIDILAADNEEDKKTEDLIDKYSNM